jgi:hypothetical protein
MKIEDLQKVLQDWNMFLLVEGFQFESTNENKYQAVMITCRSSILAKAKNFLQNSTKNPSEGICLSQ